MYLGYWGRKVMIGILLAGILISVYFALSEDHIMFPVSIVGNICFWIGLWAGFIEGSHIGRNLEKIESKEESRP